MTVHGIVTMARQEVLLRLRSGRWRILLGIWFVLVSGFTVLMHLGVRHSNRDAVDKGVVVYGALVLFVLALAMLVVPTLTSQSVNGDRERGTLATLQVTLLSPWEIAVGKLMAGWGTATVFLLLTIPAMAYSAALGGVTVGRMLVVALVVVLLLGVVAALALCLSAVLSRTTTSGVLSYLVVFGLCLGTLIAFGISLPLTQERYTQRIDNPCPPVAELEQQGVPPEEIPRFLENCGPQEYESTRVRQDKVWWLLVPNPFVILADAAPALPPLSAEEQARREQLSEQGIYTSDLRDSDPLGALGRSIRDLRHGPDTPSVSYGPGVPERERRLVWPYGLAFDLLLAAGAVLVTSRRLRAPTRTLPRGQRVA